MAGAHRGRPARGLRRRDGGRSAKVNCRHRGERIAGLGRRARRAEPIVGSSLCIRHKPDNHSPDSPPSKPAVDLRGAPAITSAPAESAAGRRRGRAHRAPAERCSPRTTNSPRVPVPRGPREALRAPALGVEERELARHAGEPAAVVVEHPRLEHVAAPAAAQAERARLLGEVGQRGRADQPVAARRRAGGSRCGGELPATTATTPRRGVERGAARPSPPSVLSSGLCAKTSMRAAARAAQLGAQPARAAPGGAAPREPPAAVDGVEHERARLRRRGRRRSRASARSPRRAARPARRAARSRAISLGRGSRCGAPGRRAPRRPRPGAPAASSASTAARGVDAACAGAGRGRARRPSASPSRPRRSAPSRGTSPCTSRSWLPSAGTTARQARASGTAAARRRPAPGGAGRRGRAGRRAGRGRRRPARRRSRGAPVSGSTRPPSSTASAWSSSVPGVRVERCRR